MAEGGGQTSLGVIFWELEIRAKRAEAEREAHAAGQGAGAAFDKGFNTETAGQKGAKQFVDSLSQDLQKRREEIRAQAVAGLLNTKEAAAAGRQAAAQYSKELRAGLVDLRTQGVIAQRDLPALYGRGADALRVSRIEAERLAFQLGGVDRATQAAGGSLGKLRGPLTILATSALGVNTSVGRLASTLLLMGAGATLTLGVTAALAAFAFGYQKITASAREARKQIDDVIDALKRQVQQEELASAAGMRRVANTARADADAARKRFIEASTPQDVTDPNTGQVLGKGGIDREAQRKAAKEMVDAKARVEAAERNAGEQQQSRTEKYVSALGRLLGAGIKNNAMTGEAAARVRQHTAALDKLIESGSKSEKTIQEMTRLQGMIEDLTAADRAKEKADERAAKAGDRAADARVRAREAFDAAIAGKTPGKEDDLESQIRRLTFAAKEAGLGATEIGSRVAALRAAFAEAAKVTQDKLATQLRDITAATTITAVDDLENALADLVKTMKAEGATDGLIEKVKALQQPVIDATARSEALQAVLERIKGDTEEGFNLVGNLEELDGRIAKASAARDAAPKGSTAQRAAQADLDELLKVELEIRERIEALRLKTVKHSATVREQTIQLAGDISNAANAAFGLASAFLGVDNNITKALGSIGQLAGGINAALSAKNLLSAIPGIGQALGGALALASSLFGKDPAIERARQETLEGMKSLRAALVELKDVYLQDVSTSTIKADIRNIEKIYAGTSGERILQPGEGNGPGRRGNLRAIGRTIGQDFDSGALLAYFKELDRKYGTNLASFIEREDPYGLLQAMRELPGALKVELSELGKFANDAAGTIAKVNYGLDLMGNSNAADRFRATIKGLLAAGIDLGEFADEMAELSDPTTSAERISEIIDYVLGRLEAGGANFGGLTPEELRELFKQGVDARRAESGGTGGFNVVSTITEATGSRIGGLMTTGNIFAQQTADNTALIARILAMTANIGPIGPPPLNLPSGGMGGTTINFTGDFNFTINGEAATPDVAKRLGKAFTDAAVAEMDKRLGERVRWMKRVNGDLT